MKVNELIELLKTMPQDASLGYVWDGGVRGKFDIVYLSNDNNVVCADNGEYVSDDEECPKGKLLNEYNMFYFDESNGYDEL